MSAIPVRHPAVAGRFYPGEAEVLQRDVRTYLAPSREYKPVRALGCIAPHAGYIYSGHVAGAVFSRLEIPEICLLLCPNHTGQGHALAIVSEGAWETPLGQVPIDSAFASALKRRCSLLQEDRAAHRGEHAIEVELPFLQMLQPKLRVIPIALGTRHFEVLDEMGTAIGEAVTAHPEPVLIIASSDMNHYESDAVTRVKDQSALDPIFRLDPRGLYDAVMNQNISMCGFGPSVAMLTAAKKLGGISAELVKYATSGDVSGDLDFVVGYAGVIVPAP